MPKNFKEVLLFNKENKNEYWQKAIMEEMTNVRVAFDVRGKERFRLKGTSMWT